MINNVELCGPFDCEGHISQKDARYYMLDFARLFPCEAITPNSPPGAHLYRLLRPEFVQHHWKPLSSDAFSVIMIFPYNLLA